MMPPGAPSEGMSSTYQSLIWEFINDRISAAEFQSSYIKKFKKDDNQTLGTEFDILDGLFADADDYCSDPELRTELHARYAEIDPKSRSLFRALDDDELRERARAAYRKLYEA